MTTPTHLPALLPCPFCGASKLRFDYTDRDCRDGIVVHCVCGAEGKTTTDCDSAAEAWNTRMTAASPNVDALAKAAKCELYNTADCWRGDDADAESHVKRGLIAIEALAQAARQAQAALAGMESREDAAYLERGSDGVSMPGVDAK